MSFISKPLCCFSFLRFFNDGEALERSGQLGQPIAAARPDGILPGQVVFRETSSDVLCIALQPRLLKRHVLCIALNAGAHSDVFVCEHTSQRGSSGDVSCVSRSSPGAHGDVFVCEYIWLNHLTDHKQTNIFL